MLYHFYNYSLDEARRELRRAEQCVAVEPKMFQVLLYLLQHRDRVVSKAELLEQCWPETFGKRSDCQNRTLAITPSDGIPCRHGYASLITPGTLGTDATGNPRPH